MVPVPSSAAIQAYVVVALFGLLVLRGAYRLTHGVRASYGRLFALPVLYVAIYAGTLAAVQYALFGSSLATLALISLAADGSLFAVGVVVAYRYTEQHLTLYQAPGQTAWSYRMNALLPVLYVVLFFARVGLETTILNETPFEIPGVSAFVGLSTVALLSLAVVDALWGLSTGFLVGRNAAAYRLWQARLRQSPPLPEGSRS